MKHERQHMLILKDGSSFSWVSPLWYAFTLAYNRKIFTGMAGLAVAVGTKDGGNQDKKTIGSEIQIKRIRARFTVACTSCIDSYSSNILKRGQNPERREFISTCLRMDLFTAAVLAVTTHLFNLRRIYQ